MFCYSIPFTDIYNVMYWWSVYASINNLVTYVEGSIMAHPNINKDKEKIYKHEWQRPEYDYISSTEERLEHESKLDAELDEFGVQHVPEYSAFAYFGVFCGIVVGLGIIIHMFKWLWNMVM